MSKDKKTYLLVEQPDKKSFYVLVQGTALKPDNRVVMRSVSYVGFNGTNFDQKDYEAAKKSADFIVDAANAAIRRGKDAV